MEIVIGVLIGLAAAALAFYFINRSSTNQISDKVARERSEMELQFRNLAEESLRRNREEFLALAGAQFEKEQERAKGQLAGLKSEAQKEVELLVRPLADTLKRYQEGLSLAEQNRSKEYGSLDRMLKVLSESNEALKKETTNLSHALKRPTVRGRWGEIQLRRVVELSGMSAHCDFSEQNSVTTEEESKLRPDMVINLPNKRKIVLDSKAVMDAYLDAEAATDDEVRKNSLRRHAMGIRSRIQDLSRKSYWDQFPESPEFVILFIPGEAFFSAALQADPELVEYGFHQKVVLATPTNLMALLKAVEYGWRQEQVAENARKISLEAVKIYQGLATWSSHLGTVGTSLDRSVKAYNAAMGSLERTVLPPVRRLRELGVSAKDEVVQPPSIETAARELMGGTPQKDPS
ncbi:MAG TPA: DNA recombination protein RmuC [Bdellovibrionota bacterium]|jgi:DNA recombination protein RmuC|nr:DNA recombination protein RmuC [Bdellovibrionota bacterium]